MKSVRVTLETFHALRSALKLKASRNINDMVVTLPTFHASMFPLNEAAL